MSYIIPVSPSLLNLEHVGHLTMDAGSHTIFQPGDYTIGHITQEPGSTYSFAPGVSASQRQAITNDMRLMNLKNEGDLVNYDHVNFGNGDYSFNHITMKPGSSYSFLPGTTAAKK